MTELISAIWNGLLEIDKSDVKMFSRCVIFLSRRLVRLGLISVYTRNFLNLPKNYPAVNICWQTNDPKQWRSLLIFLSETPNFLAHLVDTGLTNHSRIYAQFWTCPPYLAILLAEASNCRMDCL